VRNLEDAAKPGEVNPVELEGTTRKSSAHGLVAAAAEDVEGPQELQEGERRDSRESQGE
jgi:hypothetical protein